MIAWSIEAALGSLYVDHVYVSTDDADIAAVARQYGAEVVLRPDDLSGDRVTSECALLHTLDEVPEADLLVFMQCTSPLTLSEDVDHAISKLIEEEADSCFTVTDFHYFVWEMDAEGQAVGINHDKAVRLCRQDRESQYVETGAVYVMRVDGFKRAKHRFFGKTVLFIMPSSRCFEIDEPEDLLLAKALMNVQSAKFDRQVIPFTPKAVVFDFDGVFTNNKVYVDQNAVESVRCDRSDGWGITQLKKSGILIAVLSTEVNGVVQARCQKLGIECHQGLGENKVERFESWCLENAISMQDVVFVGNDNNDIACLLSAGWGVVPSDAYPGAVAISNMVLKRSGGNGAVREVCELILKEGVGRQ